MITREELIGTFSDFSDWTTIYHNVRYKLEVSLIEKKVGSNDYVDLNEAIKNLSILVSFCEMCLCMFPGEDQQILQERLQKLINCLFSVTKMLSDKGLAQCVQLLEPMRRNLYRLAIHLYGTVNSYWLSIYSSVMKKLKVEGENLNCTEFVNELYKLNELIKLIYPYKGDQIDKGKLSELINRLNSVIKLLSDRGLPQCALLLAPLHQGLRDLFITLADLPNDIICSGIAPYLSYKDLTNISLTSTFFQNKKFKELIAKTSEIKIAAGSNHTLVLKNGKVFGFGANNHGQLGLGDTKEQLEDKLTPQRIKIPGEPVDIFAGGDCSFVLCKEGLYAFGRLNCSLSEEGALVLQEPQKLKNILVTSQPSKIAIGQKHTLLLCPDGQLLNLYVKPLGPLGTEVTWSVDPRKKILGKTPCQIAAGSFHSLVLCKEDDDTLYVFMKEQLWLDPEAQSRRVTVTISGKKISQIAANGNHSLALCMDVKSSKYELYSQSLGSDSNGQLQPTPQKIAIQGEPVQIAAGGDYSLVLCKDGELFRLFALEGKDQSSVQKVMLPQGQVPCQIVAGGHHSLIYCTDDTFLLYGRNKNGQLGVGHRKNQCKLITPGSPPPEETCLVM